LAPIRHANGLGVANCHHRSRSLFSAALTTVCSSWRRVMFADFHIHVTIWFGRRTRPRFDDGGDRLHNSKINSERNRWVPEAPDAKERPMFALQTTKLLLFTNFRCGCAG
jgi:hypothetical protein